jgi:hypothetical protein
LQSRGDHIRDWAKGTVPEGDASEAELNYTDLHSLHTQKLFVHDFAVRVIMGMFWNPSFKLENGAFSNAEFDSSSPAWSGCEWTVSQHAFDFL